MIGEIISVGTELLLGQTVDTNAAVLGQEIAALGISCTHRQTVGDNLARLTAALVIAVNRSDIVFTIGGLGPTQDDLTRDGIAAALDDELILDPALERTLRVIFERRKLAWVDSQLRQAHRPSSSRAVENPFGTAPGLIAEKNGKIIIALPGPPQEFVPMLEGPVREFLASRSGCVIASKVVRVCGLGEAVVEDKLRDLIDQENPTVAPYAKPSEVHLRVTSRAASESEAFATIDLTVEEISRRLGAAVYAIGDQSLEAVVLSLLRDREQTVTVAESCTGGGLGARFTSVPGSSDVFLGGVVTYVNQLKQQLLGVKEATLRDFGAVSEPCAIEMAQGARDRLTSTWALSITGIAGPGGGTSEKPVGLVFVGIAGPGVLLAEEHRFRGSREQIRQRSTQAALMLLRGQLLEAQAI